VLKPEEKARLEKIVRSGKSEKRDYDRVPIILMDYNVKELVQTYGISYRSSGKFFNNHPEFMSIAGIKRISTSAHFSYRAIRMDNMRSMLISLI
jgi:hypothetical protein